MPPSDPAAPRDPPAGHDPAAGATSVTARPIDEDVSCIGCGYNLRGLVEDARCPECGGSIAPSVEAHRLGGSRPLHLSDRRWVRRLAAGAACLFLAALLPYLLLLWRAQRWAGYHDLIAAAFAFLACWLISERESATPPSQDPKWTRWMLRACAAAPLLARAFSPLTELPWHGTLYLTIPASYLLYRRLASVAGRMTAGRPIRRQARALALLVPAAIVACVAARFEGGSTSLWRIAPPAVTGVGIPAFGAYGVAVVLRWMSGFLGIAASPATNLAALLSGVSSIWSAGFAAGAMVALLRELRRNRSDPRAG